MARLQTEGLDVTRGTLSHWETGRYKVPIENPKLRESLANALETSIPELLVMAGYEIEKNKTEYALRGALIISELPVEVQRMAVEYLELLKRQQAKI